MPDLTHIAEDLPTIAALQQRAADRAGTPPDVDVADLDYGDRSFVEETGRLWTFVDQRPARLEAWPSKVGERFADARLADLDGPLADIAHEWDGTRNLLLLGDVGVGKTHAAAAMAFVQHVDHGHTLIFVSSPLLLDGMRPGRDDADLARQHAIDVDLLVIDDLGSEKASDWTAEQLGIVVDERYRRQRPTVVTSNLSPDRLREKVGDRIWSRLYGQALRFTIGGDDRRKAGQ